MSTADYALTVRLFDSPDAGTLVWGPQEFDGGVGPGHGALVPVVQGYFNLILGPVDTLGRTLNQAFAGAICFVEVTVGGGPPIRPRPQILSTPYALQSGNGAPPGSIMAFGTTNVPSGWLLCDGRVVRRSDYPQLFAVIQNTWGAGNGADTFHLPDLRGVFLRGWDNSPSTGVSGRDPQAGTRLPSKPGGAFDNAVGTVQPHAFQGHLHGAGNLHAQVSLSGGNLRMNRNLNVPSYTVNVRVSGLSISQTPEESPFGTYVAGESGPPIAAELGPPETRPINAAVSYIIKF